MRKTNELQAAYVHFAHSVGRLLESKGAEHLHGVYRLRTPGGLLALRAHRNWIICRFANPVGGYIVTRGKSQEHNGYWATNFPNDVDTLTNETLLRGFEHDLDQILGFELTDEQRQAIACEAEARARLAAIVDAAEDEAGGDVLAHRIYEYGIARLNLAGATSGRFRADGASTPQPTGK